MCAALSLSQALSQIILWSPVSGSFTCFLVCEPMSPSLPGPQFPRLSNETKPAALSACGAVSALEQCVLESVIQIGMIQ